MLWLQHDSFTREFKRFSKKQTGAAKGLDAVQKLLAIQFDPINPREVIAPAKINRVHQNAVWELWKIEAIVQGLRPGQWPRIWFTVSGESITFLVIGTHTDNYDNNTMDRLALERLSDLE